MAVLLAFGWSASRTDAAGVTLTSQSIIGFSAQGRAIEATCLGNGSRSVLVIGDLHTGHETVTGELVAALETDTIRGVIDLPVGVELCVIPVANPDGLANGTHTNARGVDLNRNWPSLDWQTQAYHPVNGSVSGGITPLSEPESAAIYRYITERRPDAVVVWHCCGGVVDANNLALGVDYGARYAELAGYAYIEAWTLYPVTGQFIDAMAYLGIPAIDVEMTDIGSVEVDRHRGALQGVLEQVAAGK